MHGKIGAVWELGRMMVPQSSMTLTYIRVVIVLSRDNLEEEQGQGGKQNHLADGVDSDQKRAELGIAPGELVPDQHHRDAPARRGKDDG